ncbi:hypothetical protein [Dyella japonica]|uniref:Uncharacterized protein n=1 Tax=Dyella japonica DSM 16301 TaxID=1440762 RepID=A0A0G9HCK6_9GAMM|nr:hypothetical protein [Dyella japonica]KLD65437.1 hypothetical protein Y882_02655 [Dyella japonica DSM 16301]
MIADSNGTWRNGFALQSVATKQIALSEIWTERGSAELALEALHTRLPHRGPHIIVPVSVQVLAAGARA